MLRRWILSTAMTIAASPVAAQPDAPKLAQSTDAAVAVPREVLERYVGCYELNGTVATIGLTSDGRLTAQLTAQPPGPPMRTVSASEFAVDAIGARLSFEGDGPKASWIRSRYAGNEVTGRRIAPTRLATAASPEVCPAAAPFDAAARGDVVNALSSALRERYVFPEVGERAAARIEAALAAGEYDNLSDPAAFAARLNGDLSVIAHDKHLRIGWTAAPDPAPARPAAGMETPLSPADVVRADKLAGGIGYLEVLDFIPPAAFKLVIDRAMTALAGSKALIIDVRRNPGGWPDSVAYLISFLVPQEQSVHITDIVSRSPGTQEFVRRSIRTGPTPVSFPGVPVYVLTSNRTLSGGEAFAYDVQALGRGQVVGELTGGAANPTGPIALGNGLVAGIPFARAENPITKTNWEGRGVQPDVVVPAAEALKVALERLGQGSGPEAALDTAAQAHETDPSARNAAPDVANINDNSIVVTAETEQVTRREAYDQAVEVSRVGRYQLMDEALPRFWAPICPGVAGLKIESAEWMVSRIRSNAERAGIRLARADCSPNLIVAFVDSGRSLLANLQRQQPGLFRLVSADERTELLDGPEPVRVWSNMAWRWTGRSAPPNGWPKLRASHGGAWSRAATPEARDIVTALVAIDRAEVKGKTLTQIADYATMRGLARTRAADGDEPLATILALFAGGAQAPAEMTDFDIAYLSSLYGSVPNRPAVNRLLKVRQLTRRLEAEKAEP